jgi:cytosine/adenosine deaminase-related metal-dependent hydrolase
VEREDAILADTIRVIDRFHDARGRDGAGGVAPCSPFSVSRELMRDAACWRATRGDAAHPPGRGCRRCGLQPCQIRLPPGEYAQDLGWTGPDVWHAHCVQLMPPKSRCSRSRTGVAHCPCSNCRLGSGIAPVRAMLEAGVPVGLGWMVRPATTAAIC